MASLKPLEEHMNGLAKRLARLRPSELAEIADFIADPQPPPDVEAAVQQAGAQLDTVRARLKAIPLAALDDVRTTETPSEALRAAVEAVAVMFDIKHGFASAQNRLMRSPDDFLRRLLTFDADAMPTAAANRLRRYLESPAPPEEAEPVAAALRAWVEAMLEHDLARDEAKMSMEQHSCTVAMQTACECVCDLYGLHSIDDDLCGVLQMAAKFPAAQQTTGLNEDEQQEQQLEGLQQKVFRLKQFLVMLHKDMEASSHAAGPKRDEMRSKMGYLNDRYTFNTALSGNANDELFKAALTALLLMLQSDALSKESDVFKAAASWINPMKRDSWDKFFAAVRGLETEINEGRTKGEDWSKVKGLADHLAQHVKGHRFRAGSQLCVCLCEWIIAASGYLELSSEMAAKKKQYDALKKELQGAQKELDEVIDRDDQPDGISPTLIKSVMKASREAGAPVCREQAVWALKRTSGNEGAAIEMITCQGDARRVLQCLQAPGELQSFVGEGLGSLTGAQVRKARQALRLEGVKELVEKILSTEEEDELDDDETKDRATPEASAKLPGGPSADDDDGSESKCGKVSMPSDDDNGDDSEEEEEEQDLFGADEEGDEEEDSDYDEDAEFDDDYEDDDDEDEEEDDDDEDSDDSEESDEKEESDASDDEVPHRRSGAKKAPSGAGPEKSAGPMSTSSPDLVSRAERLLLRWVNAACEHHEKRKHLEPQEQKVILFERRIAQKVRDLDKLLHEARLETSERAKKLDIPMELFPIAEPWSYFPWEGAFGPRSRCEDDLRQAIGLRELPQLEALLAVGADKGLTKRNSRIFFEGLELRELLQAEATLAAEKNVAALTARVDQSKSTLETDAAAADSDAGPGGHEDAPIRPHLKRALQAFVEPVNTSVLATVPRQRSFAEVLDEHCDQFSDFICTEENESRRRRILGMVSNSMGVSDIETEQCREQEQEKECVANVELAWLNLCRLRSAHPRVVASPVLQARAGAGARNVLVMAHRTRDLIALSLRTAVAPRCLLVAANVPCCSNSVNAAKWSGTWTWPISGMVRSLNAGRSATLLNRCQLPLPVPVPMLAPLPLPTQRRRGHRLRTAHSIRRPSSG